MSVEQELLELRAAITELVEPGDSVHLSVNLNARGGRDRAEPLAVQWSGWVFADRIPCPCPNPEYTFSTIVLVQGAAASTDVLAAAREQLSTPRCRCSKCREAAEREMRGIERAAGDDPLEAGHASG